MKKKILPAIMAAGVILLAVLIILISALVNKLSPSKEILDLKTYYSITEDNQVPLIHNNALSSTYAVTYDNEVYLSGSFVNSKLSSRFYWDSNENVLLYATTDTLYTVEANASSYSKDKKSIDFDHVIVKPTSDGCYISISFLAQFVDIQYEVCESPKRLLLNSKFGEYTVASTKKATQLRNEGNIKSPILKELEKNEQLIILEETDGWKKVMSLDGIIGYVQSKRIGASSTETTEHKWEEETYFHDLKEEEICLGWQYMEYKQGQDSLSTLLSTTKGVNVISPTWFRLCDEEGNVKDVGSESYVKYAHSQNIEVWALVNDFDTEEYYGDKVLTHTSARQYLENQLIGKALAYNLDGINIDFEKIDETLAPHYLQFIRELAIKCHNNGIRLSVDNYMPSEWNTYLRFDEQALFADYVVLMGYDEHWAGSDPGSVSSICWVKSCVATILNMVPADQVVLAMPFYTRLYKYTPNDNYATSEVIELSTCYDLSSKAYTMTGIYNAIGDHANEAVWDEDAGQYRVEYTNSDNSIVMVWLETLESLEGRLKVVDENKLAGCAFWRLGQEKEECWDIIIKYIN